MTANPATVSPTASPTVFPTLLPPELLNSFTLDGFDPGALELCVVVDDLPVVGNDDEVVVDAAEGGKVSAPFPGGFVLLLFVSMYALVRGWRRHVMMGLRVKLRARASGMT